MIVSAQRHQAGWHPGAVLLVVLLTGCSDDLPTDHLDPRRPTTIELSPPSLSLHALGDTVRLTATVKDQSGVVMESASVGWNTSNDAVGSVSASGLVTATGNGTATITAVSGNASESAPVTVAQAAMSVNLSPTLDTLFSAGDTTRLTAVAEDRNGNVVPDLTVTWTSSDSGVVGVDSSGLTTSAGPNGGATVTATVDGYEGQAAIAVVTGPQGGTVIAAEGAVTLEVPEGAVSEAISITVDPVPDFPNPERVVAGAVFDFGPDGTEFTSPVQVTIRYDTGNLPSGVTEEDLRLHRLVDGTWLQVPGSTVDVAEHTVTGKIVGFSTFGVAKAGYDLTIVDPNTNKEANKISNAKWTDNLTLKGVPLNIYEGELSYQEGYFAFANVARCTGLPDCNLPESLIRDFTYFFGWNPEYPPDTPIKINEQEGTPGTVRDGPDPNFPCRDENLAGDVGVSPRYHEWVHILEGVMGRDWSHGQVHCFAYELNKEYDGREIKPDMKEALEWLCKQIEPPPPPPCNSCGDVHLRTPDGLYYDFQGAGEYLLISSSDGEVVVQTRQQPWQGSDFLSVNTAVAMQVSGDRVGVYVDRSPDLYINGQPTSLVAGPLDLPNGGTVYRSDGSSRTQYLVEWPNGFVVSAKVGSSHMNVGVAKPAALQTAFSGILGNLNGIAEDDAFTRDGTVLPGRITFGTLYGAFGDGWRITQDEALFDYDPGTSTATFTLLDFPQGPFTAKDLDPADYEAARLVCEAAGITDPILLEDCILDVAGTGNTDFTESGVDTAQPETPLEVEVPVSITVSPDNLTPAVGEQIPLTATGDFVGLGQRDITTAVRWRSSTPAVTVDSSGVATVNSRANAILTATDAATGIVGNAYFRFTDLYFLRVDDVSLNGGGTAVWVDPGATIDVSATYTIWSRIGCPGCIDYIALGIEADGQSAYLVGIPGAHPGRSGSAGFSLTAPNSSGPHTVYAFLAPVTSGGAAIGRYENRFPDQGDFIPIGTIWVR